MKETSDSPSRYAVPVMELGLKWAQADESQLMQLLQKVASADAWSLTEPKLAPNKGLSPMQKVSHTLKDAAKHGIHHKFSCCMDRQAMSMCCANVHCWSDMGMSL